MSERKVSRSLIDTSASVCPGAGSHAHFRQPENELRQKLDALDTSFKISNKKISSETRELRQILFDLQRDLKVSKSVSHYVPTSIEEQQEQVKRQRRTTVAGTQEIGRRDVLLPVKKLSPETGGAASRELSARTPETTTKRRRKISGAQPQNTKILIHEEDVFGRENENAEKLAGEKDLDVETEVVWLAVEHGRLDDGHNLGSSEQELGQTNTCKYDESKVVTSESPLIQTREESIPEVLQSHASTYSFPVSDLYKDLRDAVDIETDSRVRNPSLYHPGMFSYSVSEAAQPSSDPSKGTTSGSTLGYGLTYSKHFNEDRKRSLSESDASYRDAFKGRFMTQSLPEKLKDQRRLQLPPPEPQKRFRRVTVSGPPPMGARRLLDIGDIPVTPFYPGARRKKSTGMGPRGGLSMRRGDDDETSNDVLFESNGKEAARGTCNLTAGRPQEQRRRSSSVRKTSSYLPPLKEETRSATKAEVSSQWKNLDQCRYLRKEDQPLSIEDIFKKD